MQSINRQNPSDNQCTNVNSVTFRVTFNEVVDDTSVTTDDFTLTYLSGSGESITSVTPVAGTGNDDDEFDVVVNVSGVSSTAEIRLDFTGSATDLAGNTSTQTYNTGQTYKIDHSEPTASVSGTSGTCYMSAPTSVSGTASDVGCGGVSTVQVAIWVDYGNDGSFTSGTDYYYDGTNWNASSEQPLNANYSSGSWTYNLPSSFPNNNARYYVQVRATDGAGNTSSWSNQTSWYFVLDNTAPEVSTINDGGATYVKSGDEVTITFDVTETNSLQNNPTVKITDASDNQIGTATYASSSGSTYTYKFTVGTGDYQNCKINSVCNRLCG